MKKLFICLFVLSVSFVLKAQDLFNPEGLYLITCNDTKVGGLSPSSQGIYPLIYNEGATESTSRALWTIKEEAPDKYSFRNSETGQYLQYAPDNATGKYVEMVDELSGSYTLFVITSKSIENEINYWTITSVVDDFILDKKKYDNAVGLYRDANDGNNQLFSFKEKDGSFVNAPNQVYGFEKYLSAFTLNAMELTYDKREDQYFYSIALDQFGGDVTRLVNFIPKQLGYILTIDGQVVADGQEYVFNDAQANKAYVIRILNNDEVICSNEMIFTGLPIVQLYTEGNSLSTDFSKGKIRVYEGNKELSGELTNAEMRYRGASATGYEKKAFAIKLRNADWESVDRSFFGLRNDNYWILDAMAMDKSRMRNRVCTDIWNDFSADPYFKAQEPNMINATRGQYVEVFLDDEYWGLYCMTERIDRKQLKLKKYQEATETIRGVLYKAIQWSKATLMGYPDYNGLFNEISEYDNQSDSWDRFEVKYPDMEDGEKIDWSPLSDIVTFVANSNTINFRNYISQDVDLPVWLDYYLLMELILATDNHGKNAYYYMYNINNEKKLGIAPWDMDGVFGIQWGAKQIEPDQDYSEYIRTEEWGENYLYKRLKDRNVAGFNDLLKSRYDVLRFSHFSVDKLIQRFGNYMEMFETVGAVAREEKRWDGANRISLDMEEELAYVTDWIIARVNYLNEQYGPVIPSGGIGSPKENSLTIYPNPVVETLYVNDVTSGSPYWVYTETGICIDKGSADSNSFSIDFSNYPTGRYYLKVGETGKVIIKK